MPLQCTRIRKGRGTAVINECELMLFVVAGRDTISLHRVPKERQAARPQPVKSVQKYRNLFKRTSF